MSMTVEQFVEHITASGLMSNEAFRDWIAAIPVTERPQDGEQLARALVKQKKLTKFQAEQLYAGKGKSLTLGNYVLLDLLGQGGMGMVFKAQHTRMGRQVALKVMSPRAMKSAVNVQRFHREVQVAAKLIHPNIVTAFDADEAKGTHFLVMELVEGSDLASHVKRHGPMSSELAIECVLQAARGLGFAHSRGVIHRDIKPHNLLMSVNHETEQSCQESRSGQLSLPAQSSTVVIKILDMGLARHDGSVGESADQAHLTNSGAMMGTVDYMAPEQAMDSKRADARSDIYSLGCTFFYLLTGQVTFKEDTVMKRLTAHQNTAPPRLEDAVPQAHLSWSGDSTLGARPTPGRLAALDSVFQRMVAKNPAERFQSMAEVVTALERFRTAMPAVEAEPSGGDSALQSFLNEMASGRSSSSSAASGSHTGAIIKGQSGSAIRSSATANAEHTIVLPTGTPLGADDVTLAESELASVSDTADSEFSQTLTSQMPQAQTSAFQRVPQRTWWIAAGVAFVLLFGAIVFKITRPDGAVTKLTVPEGTDVDLSGLPKGSKVEVVGNTPAMAPVAKVKMDLTPAKPLGTWEMGPEPEWFREGGHSNSYLLKESPVLPGLIERPAKLPGIKRWNVDTVGARNHIYVVKYSPDGKWLATGSMDGHVRIYDAQTLDLHRLLPGRASQVGVSDVSWHPDSERLAIVADESASVRIVDRSGSVLLEEKWGGNLRPAQCVAWNHSGTQFVIGTIDDRERNEGNLEIREASGKLVKRLATQKGLGCHRSGNVVWSQDDKLLAVRHLDNKVRLWNTETGEAQVLAEDVLGDTPHGLAWSKDDWLAVSTSQGTRFYGPDRKLARTLETSFGQPVWSPDGKRIIVLTHGTDRVVDRDTGAVIAEGELAATVGDWHPDGTQIAGGYFDISVASADFKTVLNRRYSGVVAEPLGSDWSPDGRWLAIARRTRVFNEEGREQPFVFENKPADAPWFQGRRSFAIVWRPDSKVLLGGPALIPVPNTPERLHLWMRTEDGVTRKFFDDPTGPDQGWTMVPRCWSPDGKFVIVTGGKGVLKVLDASGKLVKNIPTSGSVDPNGPHACWNPATNLVAVLENGQPLKFLDPKCDWELKPVSDKPLAFDVNGTPQWSPDGQTLGVYGSEWFDLAGNSIGSPSARISRWSPDGKQWIATHQAGDVGIFDSATKTQTRQRISNNSLASSHAWHPRGNLIAHVSAHSMVTVWRESDLQPHWHAALLPDDKSATFSAAGELLNEQPADLDRYLIYYLDRGDGRIETVPPAEFRKLLPPTNEQAALNRSAAEHVLKLDGEIRIVVAEHGKAPAWLQDANQLPAGDFEVTYVAIRNSTRLNDNELRHLKGLKRLKTLDLSFCRNFTDAGLSILASLESLEAIRLNFTNVTNDVVPELLKAPSLNDVELGEVLIRDPAIERLVQGMPRLKRFMVSAAASDECIKTVASAPNLNELMLKKTHFTSKSLPHLQAAAQLDLIQVIAADDGSLEKLAALSQVQTILLNVCEATPTGLRALMSHPRLMWLYLTDSPQIGDEHAEVLAEWPRPISLSLRKTAITNRSMGLLAKAPHWEELDVQMTALTDDAVKDLSRMTKLRRLKLQETKITRDGIEALRQALPNCYLETNIGAFGTPPSSK